MGGGAVLKTVVSELRSLCASVDIGELERFCAEERDRRSPPWCDPKIIKVPMLAAAPRGLTGRAECVRVLCGNFKIR